MVKGIIFLVVSAAIIYISWPYLLRPQLYGFGRFFAFEATLILIIVNVGYWFQDPFSRTQLVSWLLLTGSLFLVIHGFYLIKVAGKPADSIEDTTVLVVRGAYRYIRHPIYCSLLVGSWGVWFKHPSLPGTLLVIIVMLAVLVTARAEEQENRDRFGEEYRSYMNRTKRFIPFVY